MEYVKARHGVANDNAPSTDDMGVDSVMVMRPTVEEVARASTKIKDGKPADDGEIGLRFDARGRLIAWRVADIEGVPTLNSKGEEVWLKPTERYKQPRGGKSNLTDAKADDIAHAERVLSLRGSGTFPPVLVMDNRYPSFGAVFERIRAAYDAMMRIDIVSKNRQFLNFHWADGDRTLEQASAGNPQATVTRGRTVIARGAEFMAGKTDKSGTATEGSFVGASDAVEMTMASALDANAESVKIDSVLDMALAGLTAREIAESKGWQGKHGERKAVVEIDAAIAQLRRAA